MTELSSTYEESRYKQKWNCYICSAVAVSTGNEVMPRLPTRRRTDICRSSLHITEQIGEFTGLITPRSSLQEYCPLSHYLCRR